MNIGHGNANRAAVYKLNRLLPLPEFGALGCLTYDSIIAFLMGFQTVSYLDFPHLEEESS